MTEIRAKKLQSLEGSQTAMMDPTFEKMELEVPAGHSRVVVAFLSDDGKRAVLENMHAVPVGDDLYRLDTSPFYVYGVSFGDVVCAPVSDGQPVFAKVMEHRGHSTYRVRPPAGKVLVDLARHLRPLKQLGCSFEGSGVSAQQIYSIDVPPNSDAAAVCKILEGGEFSGWWGFEEAHCCELQPDLVRPQGS